LESENLEIQENLEAQENLELAELGQWEFNHNYILEKWEEIYNEGNGKRPTQLEISKRTGLSRHTIAKHLKRTSFDVDISPVHILNITPMLDEFYLLIHDKGIPAYAKGKLILEYIKLIGNPTEKREVKQLEATKLFIEIADNKKIKDSFNNITDESK
jgi:hypothetical protein